MSRFSSPPDGLCYFLKSLQQNRVGSDMFTGARSWKQQREPDDSWRQFSLNTNVVFIPDVDSPYISLQESQNPLVSWKGAERQNCDEPTWIQGCCRFKSNHMVCSFVGGDWSWFKSFLILIFLLETQVKQMSVPLTTWHETLGINFSCAVSVYLLFFSFP